MKYCVIKDENGEKTLCRFSFEIYSWKNKSGGEWMENEEFEKIFFKKNKNYTIEIPKEEEIKEMMMKTDNIAYDDQHTFVSDTNDDNNFYKDKKGNKHRFFCYQDYESVDGIYVDGSFDIYEVINRDYYEYYKDEENNLLIKRDKETKECYIFAVIIKDKKACKEWFVVEEYDPKMKEIVTNYNYNKLKKIKNISEVVEYIDKYYYDTDKALSIEIKIEKARKIAIEKWGEKGYQEAKYYFDKANENMDYMDAIDAFLKNNNISYVDFVMLAMID